MNGKGILPSTALSPSHVICVLIAVRFGPPLRVGERLDRISMKEFEAGVGDVKPRLLFEDGIWVRSK